MLLPFSRRRELWFDRSEKTETALKFLIATFPFDRSAFVLFTIKFFFSYLIITHNVAGEGVRRPPRCPTAPLSLSRMARQGIHQGAAYAQIPFQVRQKR